MLIKFSQSLSLETSGRGIRVQALCPGFTYSEFHDVTGARALVSQMPNYLWMDAASVVQASFDALDHDRVICVPGRVNRLLKFISKHLPDQTALRLVGRRSKQFENSIDEKGEHDLCATAGSLDLWASPDTGRHCRADCVHHPECS